MSSLRINVRSRADGHLRLLEAAERGLVVVVHAPERVGHTARDGRLVVVLSPEGERSGRVRLRFRVAPGRVDDVGLELVGATMVGDLHELLGWDLEEHQVVWSLVYLLPSVQKVRRAMSVVSLSLPRSRIGRQNSKTLRIAPIPMFRCSCNPLSNNSHPGCSRVW